MFISPNHCIRFLWSIIFVGLTGIANAQSQGDSVLQSASLGDVIEYALKNQPAMKQAKLDQQITEKVIKGKLADWYPQLNFAFNYQHIFDLQASVVEGQTRTFGVHNTSAAQFTATQTLFNRDVLLASTTASTVRLQAEQYVRNSEINVVVDVSKAFYDVLATTQQIKVSKESIARLERNLKDAQSRFNAGLSDKTDYKRATISLGNAKTTLKVNEETLKYKEDYLKTVMGYPNDKSLTLEYDTLAMESEIQLDTLQQLNPTEIIDFEIVHTQKELQDANVRYSKWAKLPTLTASGAYNLNYQNDQFGELYNQRFPNSYIGATLAVPIFQGGKRNAKIQEQKLTSKRIEETVQNTENVLNTRYVGALASYKGALINFNTQKENAALADEVYKIIQLQYQNGIKTYLDVTFAETDLRTTRINYFNALYQVLSAKLDVLKALGKIN